MRTRDLRLEMVRPNIPGPPTGNSETRYRVIYDGRELGVWRDPEHWAARFLIDNRLAQEVTCCGRFAATLCVWPEASVGSPTA
jgi:hypothetical protein